MTPAPFRTNPIPTLPLPLPRPPSPLPSKCAECVTPWIYGTYTLIDQIPPTDCAAFWTQDGNSIYPRSGCIYCSSATIRVLGISGYVHYGYNSIRLQFTPPRSASPMRFRISCRTTRCTHSHLFFTIQHDLRSVAHHPAHDIHVNYPP